MVIIVYVLGLWMLSRTIPIHVRTVMVLAVLLLVILLLIVLMLWRVSRVCMGMCLEAPAAPAAPPALTGGVLLVLLLLMAAAVATLMLPDMVERLPAGPSISPPAPAWPHTAVAHREDA